MHIPNRVKAVLALATVALCVACGTDNGRVAATGSTPSADVSSVSVSPSSTPTSVDTTTTPTETAGAPATTRPAADFSAMNVTSKFQANTAPVSTTVNGKVNVETFLNAVIRSNRDVWEKVFRAASLDTPTITYDVTAGSDRYVSACTKGGEVITVTPTYGYPFYCSLDNKPLGSIALPADTLASIWKQDGSHKVLDLAGAMVASRQAGIILTMSIQQQIGIRTTDPVGRVYTATCLAGVWAHAVYGQNAFTDKELSVALAYAYRYNVQIDGAVIATNPTTELETAWIVGFRQGNPANCGQAFWR
jgi:predicted metalloprotease